VRVSQLKQWNGLRSNDLKIGQRLTIYRTQPNTSSTKTASNTVVKPSNTASSSSDVKTYKVKAGDSLWSISNKFPGVSIQNIKDWNGISGTKLNVGTTLKVSR